MAPGTRRNRLNRLPLSDLTNSSAAAARSINKYTPKKTDTKTKPRPANSSSTSVGSSNDFNKNPPAYTPLRGKDDPESSGAFSRCRSIQRVQITEVSKEGRKDKRKAVAVASSFSCPPLEKKKNIRLASDSEDDEMPLARLLSAPSKKSNKRLQHSSSAEERDTQKRQLLQDFINKQRAYFKEVDEFELPVEEASESDLE